MRTSGPRDAQIQHDRERVRPLHPMTSHEVDEDRGMQMLARVFLVGVALAIVLSTAVAVWIVLGGRDGAM